MAMHGSACAKGFPHILTQMNDKDTSIIPENLIADWQHVWIWQIKKIMIVYRLQLMTVFDKGDYFVIEHL